MGYPPLRRYGPRHRGRFNPAIAAPSYLRRVSPHASYEGREQIAHDLTDRIAQANIDGDYGSVLTAAHQLADVARRGAGLSPDAAEALALVVRDMAELIGG